MTLPSKPLRRRPARTATLPRPTPLLALLGAAALSTLLLALAPSAARAHGLSQDLSAASGLSLSVPVAVLVAAPSALLAGGAAFTVATVEASAEGTVWVLERASDGARASVRFGRDAAGTASVAAGTVVLTTAVAAGWVLSVAGEAVAFIPNELGRSLTHHERLSR